MNEHAGREQEIEAREKAAASGKWYDSEGDVFVDGLRIVACMSLSTNRADARFIAHAREDIPYLLAQLREARETPTGVEDSRRAWHARARTFETKLQQAREKLAAVEIWVKRNREQDKWPDFRDWPELDCILKGGD